MVENAYIKRRLATLLYLINVATDFVCSSKVLGTRRPAVDREFFIFFPKNTEIMSGDDDVRFLPVSFVQHWQFGTVDV